MCHSLAQVCLVFLPHLVSFFSCPLFTCHVFPSHVLLVEVVAGDNVTLWCRNRLTRPDYLFWCKHTNNSVPVYITCRFYSPSPSTSCGLITDSERVEMMVNSENSSLTIRSFNVSDSGLYYCCSLKQKYMIYSNSTYLQIRGTHQDKEMELESLGKKQKSKLNKHQLN
uniref:Ig-like domain-containing protein n=1 Tax=Astyanax mexicanus TaxID=7994 RepID=A0A3B1ILI3_ASTMX